jgi:hypothetical protein
MEQHSTFKLLAKISICFFILIVWANAEVIQIPVDNIILIRSDNNDYPRVLMRPELPVPDSGMVVNSATLSLQTSLMTNDSTFISLRFYPILTDWENDNVGWYNPWENPGGDFDETCYGEKTVTLLNGQNIEIDFTDLFQRWADSRLPYYGIIFMLSESSLLPTIPIQPDNNGYYLVLTVDYRS